MIAGHRNARSSRTREELSLASTRIRSDPHCSTSPRLPGEVRPWPLRSLRWKGRILPPATARHLAGHSPDRRSRNRSAARAAGLTGRERLPPKRRRHSFGKARGLLDDRRRLLGCTNRWLRKERLPPPGESLLHLADQAIPRASAEDLSRTRPGAGRWGESSSRAARLIAGENRGPRSL